MTAGFTDRSGLELPDPHRQVVIACQLIDGRRLKSVLVADPADRAVTAWLPRSQIAIEENGKGRLRVTMPVWLAVEKGLLALAGRGQGSLAL